MKRKAKTTKAPARRVNLPVILGLALLVLLLLLRMIVYVAHVRSHH